MIFNRTLLNRITRRGSTPEWIHAFSNHHSHSNVLQAVAHQNHVNSTGWQRTFTESLSTRREPNYIFTNLNTQADKKINSIKVLQSNYRPAFNVVIECSSEENSRQFRSLLIAHHVITPTHYHIDTTTTVFYTCQDDSLTVTKLMTLLNQLKAFEPLLDDATYNSIVGTINSLSISGPPLIDDTLRRFEQFYQRQVAIFRPSQSTAPTSLDLGENSTEILDPVLNQLELDVLNAFPPSYGHINIPEFSTTTLYSSQRENRRIVSEMGDWEITSTPRRQHGPELLGTAESITYRNQRPSATINKVYIAGTDYNQVFNITVDCATPELFKELHCILILKGLRGRQDHRNPQWGITYHTDARVPATVTNLCEFLETLSSCELSINPQILDAMVCDINHLRTEGGPLIRISGTDPRRVLVDDDFRQSLVARASQNNHRLGGNI